MSKRNSVTTNAARQMQSPMAAHVRWSSCAAQRDWQKAVNEHGARSQEAQAMFDVGVWLNVGKTQLQRAAVQAPTPRPTLDPFYQGLQRFFQGLQRFFQGKRQAPRAAVTT